ncbi:MAG TPA: YceI family protein [Gaiellaceae bacterium]|nr:YceI family protein [Gaiellaceae bacterium]
MSTIETTATKLPAGTWTADPVHSQVGFAVAYMGGTFRGTFSPFQATLEVDEDGAARLTGLVRVQDVKVQDPNLEAHLQSPDFFDAERTPEISFSADGIAREGDAVAINGELAIRGTSLPVELRGQLVDGIVDGYGKERIRLTVEGTVDRSRYGLNWNMPLPSGEPALPNDVSLTGEIFLVKA